MKNKQQNAQVPDPHLDAPSEANRDKHINFKKLEEDSGALISFKNKDEVKERRQQWQQGIEEGKVERGESASNE